MDGNAIKWYLAKLIKPVLIALPLNLLAGLIYCTITKKMSIVSYSNVLLIIGGLYAAIGGLCSIGGMCSGSDYTMNFSRDYHKKNIDNSNFSSINLALYIIGISTILISYVLIKI